jgi:hypothetical protein
MHNPNTEEEKGDIAPKRRALKEVPALHTD